jgi:hypothetical protein
MLRHLVLPFVLASSLSTALAQDGEAQPMSLGDMMSAAMKTTEPLPQHDLLRGLAGEWTYVLEMTMPGSRAMRGSGTTSVRELMGGRFIEVHSMSDGTDGFENLMLMGFDSRKGKENYFLLGIDSLGHYSIDLRGRFNEATGALTLQGEQFDSSSQAVMPYRQVFRFPGKDTMTCEVYLEMPGAREDVRIVGVVYQRESGSTAPAAATKAPTLATESRDAAAGGAASGHPAITGEEIEAMDRSELRSALSRIAKARSMTDVEDASRASLDSQYFALMKRMRTSVAAASPSRPVGSSTSVESGGMPSYGQEMIRNMTRSEARAALTEIITARRIPELDADQRAELTSVFNMILDQLRKTSGITAANDDLGTAEKESAASEPDPNGSD